MPCCARGMISLQTPYFIVHSDAVGLVVRLQRTGLDFPDISTMERDMDTIVVALDRLGRERKGLCIDWREGPLRNDTPFEDALRRVMPRLVRGYRAAAVLTRSAVGVLQVKRLFRESNHAGEVFQDESEAMDYLRASAGVMSRRPTPFPAYDRSVPTNSRGDKLSTGQMQAIDRVPQAGTTRSERHSSLPPMPSERLGAESAGRDRTSTVPPPPTERISQLPNPEDRPSSLPLPPPARPPRTH